MQTKNCRFLPVAFLLLCAVSTLFSQTQDAIIKSRQFEQLANVEHEAKNTKGFLENIKRASDLRPNHPRLLYNLAAAYALNGDTKDASVILNRLASMGLAYSIEKDVDFTNLFKTKEFNDLQKKFDLHKKPVNRSVKAFSLQSKDLITEGIAFQSSTKRFFISSIHQRKIVSVDANGKASDFSAETDGLWSVFGLRVDEQRQILWACSTPFPQMRDFQADDDGKSGIFKYDLKTGKLLKKYLLSNADGKHLLGDLTVNRQGDVYATDSLSPNIYRINSNTGEMETFLTDKIFVSLQGLTFTPDEKTLLVADYSIGIFKIDVRSKNITQLSPAKNVTALGIDGLYYYRGKLIATQNGIEPNRVAQFSLNRNQTQITDYKTLEANHPDFNEPTLGVLIGKNFYFIANSQWGFANEKGELEKEKLKEPVILRLDL